MRLSEQPMGEYPRISIVMPSYNQAPFLEEAIVSVLDQAYPDLEFILLDGGSTDGSKAILEKYTANFKYWQSRSDGGQLEALIQGFSMATGELLGWVNSDDVLLPGALKSLAATYASAPDGGLFGGNYILIDRYGIVTRVKRHTGQAAFFARSGLVAVNQPGSLVTRESFDRVGGFDPRFDYVMDTDLYYRILAAGYRYVHLGRCLSGFRIHSQAKTVAQLDRANAAGRLARASWFSDRRALRARLKLARVSYRVWQSVNGNYARSAVDTFSARGSTWKTWAATHVSTP